MKPVNEIYSEFLLGKIRFHWRRESDMYRDALMYHTDKKYVSSASLGATLYEMIFTTRLIRETSNPPGFTPAKENLEEQLQNLFNREEEVVNSQRMPFREITKELVGLGVIDDADKAEYDDFYTQIRNPVLHGLTSRLFEPMLGRTPSNIFEIDAAYEVVYEKASELLLDRIYYLMVDKSLSKE